MKKLFVLASFLAVISGCQTNQVKQDDGVASEPTAAPHVFQAPIPTASYEPGIIDSAALERRALLEILAHIEQTESLINVARAQQNPDQRIKFRYDWLNDDLHKVSRGIRDHLKAPQSQPRSVEPVLGDYRR
ncbi:MAG: RAQPRD family integrative conjugative element protein [Methyloprofundus sp.]|nr:RAQPRD family integrative conjugative element protein [Methyloprofundus sp.]